MVFLISRSFDLHSNYKSTTVILEMMMQKTGTKLRYTGGRFQQTLQSCPSAKEGQAALHLQDSGIINGPFQPTTGPESPSSIHCTLSPWPLLQSDWWGPRDSSKNG
ncbi:hypothetical protein VTO42DRAFT_3829 [Malbranchea cinnamomea]